MYYKNAIFTFSLLLIGMSGLHAQETISTSGGNAAGSGGTVSYTLGQIVYTTNTGTTGSVSQGVQQLYEISEVTSVDEGKTMNLSAYPNPTTDYLSLTIESEDLKDLSFQLYDMSGNLLHKE